jgi:hypothetical protein
MRPTILLTLAICLLPSVPGRSAHADEAAPVEPATGLWKYSEFGATTNTCKSKEVVSNGNGTFVLSKNQDGSLTIQPGDGSDAFQCTVKGADFDCPDRAALSYDLHASGVDAVLKGKGIAKGQFIDAKHMTGQQIATFECHGSACILAAMALHTSFPCKVTIEFKAAAKPTK